MVILEPGAYLMALSNKVVKHLGQADGISLDWGGRGQVKDNFQVFMTSMNSLNHVASKAESKPNRLEIHTHVSTLQSGRV